MRIIHFTLTLVSLFVFISAMNAEEKRFECMGPGGGGQFYGMGISPHDSRIMHCSTDMGPFYATENGGESWYQCNQMDMVGIKSTRPAYHPTNPDIVYMPYYRREKELRISHDRGKHWETVCKDVPWGDAKGRDKFEQFVIAIDFDSENAGLMFVSTAAGLYRSTDEGKSFKKCQGVEGIAIGTHVSTASPKERRYCIAATSDGVYVSQDSGVTWNKEGQGLSDAKGKGYFAFCAATDKDSGKVSAFITCWDKVFVSHDSGMTFTETPLKPQSGCYRFLTMAQSDPKTAYVSTFTGDYAVWKTTDGGTSWNKVLHKTYPGLEYGWVGRSLGTAWGGRPNRITCDPNNPDMILAANTMEFFRSIDGGKTWKEICAKYKGPDPDKIENNQAWEGVLESAAPVKLHFDPFIKDRAYVIYGDIGFLISEDKCSSWRRSVKGIPSNWILRMFSVIPDSQQKGVLYAATSGVHEVYHDISHIKNHGGGVVMSTDHGESWKVISNGLDTSKPCTSLAMDPNSPADNRTLYCVIQTKGVYRSTDGGKNWVKKSAGVGRPDNPNVSTVKIGPDGAIYAMVTGRSSKWSFKFGGGGLWRSNDKGETWIEVTQGQRMVFPRHFSVDPHNPDRILIATTQAPGGESAGLFETRDGGKNWSQIVGIKQVGKELYNYVHSGPITFHPTKKNIIYYATKTHGLWISRDNAQTWQRMRGVPRLATAYITFDPSDTNSMYVASIGLWRGPVDGY